MPSAPIVAIGRSVTEPVRKIGGLGSSTGGAANSSSQKGRYLVQRQQAFNADGGLAGGNGHDEVAEILGPEHIGISITYVFVVLFCRVRQISMI
jgi:hypothetical protein